MAWARLFTAVAAAFFLFAIPPQAGHASDTSCPTFFVDGQAPDFVTATHATLVPVRKVPICYRSFALLYSPADGAPLWSAEFLTKEHAQAALKSPRRGSYHAEVQLTDAADRASDRLYAGSCYDVGHMTPAGDFVDQFDTFSMANMVPQVSNLNEGLWANIESRILTKAATSGDLYIVTGPIFPPTPDRLGRRISIPTYTFKAVYDPQRHEAGVYVAPNSTTLSYVIVSVAAFSGEYGIDPFPTLSRAVKAKVATLPLPSASSLHRPARKLCPAHPE